MTRLRVDLGERGYDVLIEEGVTARAGSLLAPFARAGRLIVVTDETVWALHGPALSRGCKPLQLEPIVLPPGEGTKSWPILAQTVDRLLDLGVERGDHILAFGGGVVGDLAGFAAAIVKRGCGVVQMPTTLLAQVDGSVGGKTGINVAAGKNLVGAFHQPALVLIDPACLDTLPPRHLRAGYAEIVKYALIEDAALFAWLEAHGAAVIDGTGSARAEAIAAAVTGKAAIVAEDEHETGGRRALLNLGHTFGHALEAESGYSDQLLHGEAVAVGIVLAFALSAERGLCPPADLERVRAHFGRLGLPVSLREIGMSARGAALVGRMAHDKKRQRGRLTLILARGIGHAFLERDVAPDELRTFLDRRG